MMLAYLIYVILSPILCLITFAIGLFNHKIGEHLKDQERTWRFAQGTIRNQLNGRKIALFHAASTGEFEQLKPILRRMDRKKYFLFQTFLSPTIFNKAKNCHLFDAVCYHPFDFPWSVMSFLRKFKPDYYIVTRHDIWPNFIYFAKLLRIRSYFINANLQHKSSRLRFGLRQFNSWLFSNFSLILTGSERLKQNIANLVQPTSVIVTGDTRFDQVIDRKNQTNREYFPPEIFNTKNIILGSVIPSDYDLIFSTLRAVYPKGDQSLRDRQNRLIVVPHEVNEPTLRRIEIHLKKLDITSQLYSNINDRISTNAIVVDTVGILADLYKYAHLAYVGAGFGAGVHSVIEPAVYGCAVSFGPNISILDEAISMHEQGIGTMVHNQSEFQSFLELIDKKEELEITRQKTQEFAYCSRSASNRIIDAIFGEDTAASNM